jgi:hypothetical protein
LEEAIRKDETVVTEDTQEQLQDRGQALPRDRDTRSRSSVSTRWRWIGILAIFIVAIAVAVSVSIIVVGNNKESAPPKHDPVKDAYLKEIRTILVPNHVLSQTNAPQLRATEFMAYADSYHVNVTSPRLQQRYALFVIHFANGGERWNKDPVLHECDWMFVVCNNLTVVTKLLMGNQLDMTGPLPGEIGLLTHVGMYISSSCYCFKCDFSNL